MSHIEIIAAGAGSGKTTRLTRILEAAVVGGDARPAAIVATTFTRKAAAELAERARCALMACGRVDDAQRLTAARIGTVNAICSRLVQDFSFDLGLSPRLRMLDEEQAKRTLNNVISTTIYDSEVEELDSLSQRVASLRNDRSHEPAWVDRVREIVDRARSNGITDPDCLRQHARLSVATFSELLPDLASSAEDVERSLIDALTNFATGVDVRRDSTKATAGALDEARRYLADLQVGRILAWDDWAQLAALKAGQRFDALAAPVRRAAAEHQRHPGFRRDLSRCVELVFEIAARTLEGFCKQKRADGVLDFTDQEVLALQLLRRPEVQLQLGAEIDLLLVDEFQDTSPIQLAIFLALSKCAKRSIWVGDQKQAIYGFRGTDPALMDSTIETILGATKPKTLDRSWRSRPALVRLTSDLFTPAFEAHGMLAAGVRLEPGSETEPQGLGSIVERWILEATNQVDDAAELATRMRVLLEDPTTLVRDRDTGEPKPVLSDDVAVLCRTNASCDRVAGALEAVGIRAIRPRFGLLATPEVRAAHAAIRLRLDPDDSLAAAELARIAGHGPTPGPTWLDLLLQKPGIAAFAELPLIRRLRDSTSDGKTEGVVAAVDAAVRLGEIRELCLCWGDVEQRLENLNRLRAHAVTYVDRTEEIGAGATQVGFLTYLAELASTQADDRPVLNAGVDAVVVSTWHAAKGLEWPIVVLFDLGYTRQDSALGVHVVSERQRLDLADPLADRWVRYWPGPYQAKRTDTAFQSRLAENRFDSELQAQAQREGLRLLYVAWTRARDRVVLAARRGELVQGVLELLAGRDRVPFIRDVELSTSWGGRGVERGSGRDRQSRRVRSGQYAQGRLDLPPGKPRVSRVQDVELRSTWAGRAVDVYVRTAAPLMARAEAVRTDSYYEPPLELPVHAAAFETPSKAETVGFVGEAIEIGPRLSLSGTPDWELLGEAVHGFFSADRPGFPAEERLNLAGRLLERWHVALALRPGDLMLASDRLWAWGNSCWPNATWRREWPIFQRRVSGAVVRGRADLVIDAGDGFVVVDHKSFQGRVDDAIKRARAHAGQLDAYATAISEATSKACLGRFVYLPLLGRVVPVAGDVSTWAYGFLPKIAASLPPSARGARGGK